MKIKLFLMNLFLISSVLFLLSCTKDRLPLKNGLDLIESGKILEIKILPDEIQLINDYSDEFILVSDEPFNMIVEKIEASINKATENGHVIRVIVVLP